jgi:integrase
MQHLNDSEMRRLLAVAYKHNHNHHLLLLTAWGHGLRVSEVIGIRGTDITSDGKLDVKRLKGSKRTIQFVHRESDVLFDQSPIIELARMRGSSQLFPYTRNGVLKMMLRYGLEAGLPKSSLHPHALKNSCAMRMLRLAPEDIGVIQAYLGHVSPGSTLAYLSHADDMKAQQTFAQAVTA